MSNRKGRPMGSKNKKTLEYDSIDDLVFISRSLYMASKIVKVAKEMKDAQKARRDIVLLIDEMRI